MMKNPREVHCREAERSKTCKLNALKLVAVARDDERHPLANVGAVVS